MNALRDLWRSLRTGGVRWFFRWLHRRVTVPAAADKVAAQRLTEDDRRHIRRRIDQMANPPLIPVLLPVYNSNPAWLRACLSRGSEATPEQKERLAREAACPQAKWGAFAGSDPFVNP